MSILASENRHLIFNRVLALRQQVDAFKPKSILQLTEQVENQLTLCEIEANLNAESPDFTAFLSTRWERIRNSCMCYTQQPFNPVNLLCVDIARAIAPPALTPLEIKALALNTGPWSLLMPSLEMTEDIYGGNIHSLGLHEFILSDNERVYIPVESCLNRAYISDEGQLRHVVGIDEDWPLLTENEITRVSRHSKEATTLYDAILAYNKRRLLGDDIGVKLSQLALDLRNGGAHRLGSEFDAGSHANVGIHAFSEYWKGLSRYQQAAIFAKTPELKEIIGRLFRPDDADYSAVRFCVELVANDIDPLVRKYNNRTSLKTLHTRVLQKEAAFQAALKNPASLKVIPGANLIKHVLPLIFKLNSKKHRVLFEKKGYENALIYALAEHPEVLPEFDLDEPLRQQAISVQVNSQGDSALIVAAKNGAINAINLLLEWGASIETQNNIGVNALHCAAYNNNVTTLSLLLERGANLEAETPGKNTALTVAVQRGKADAANFLLQHNANLNARNADTINALEFAIAIHPELVEPILIHMANLPVDIQAECLLNVPNGPYPNVFHYAAATNPYLFKTLIKERLEQQPLIEGMRDSIINTSDDHGYTTLHWAAKKGDLQTVKLLLKNGADPEAKTKDGNTALNSAVFYGRKSVVELLLKKNTTFYTRNSKNNNALDLAIKYQPHLIDPLLIHMATLPIETQAEYLLNVSDGPWSNVYFYAAETKPELFKTLIKQTLEQQPPDEELRDIILKSTDANGSTAMHWAAKYGDVDTLARLIEHGGDYLGALTKYKRNTVLNIAVFYGHANVVNLLLEKHAFMNGARNADGYNALDIAVKRHPALVEPILINLSKFPLDIQARRLKNRLPNVYYYAVASNKPDLFKRLTIDILSQQPPDLKRRDAIFKATNKYGLNIFHQAAKRGDVDTLNYLLEHGADLEAKTNKQNTALNLAVKQGKVAVVELLLQKNANLNAINTEGENAIDLAIKIPELFKPILMHLLSLPQQKQTDYLANFSGGPFDNIYAYIDKKEPGFLGALLENSLAKLRADTGDVKTALDRMHFDKHLNRIYKHYQGMLKKGSEDPNYEMASSTARTLLITCIGAVDTLLQSPVDSNIKFRKFQSTCLNAITSAQPVLQKQRGWGKVIAKFLLAVITFPISLPLYAAGFFSLKAKSAQLVEKLQEDLVQPIGVAIKV